MSDKYGLKTRTRISNAVDSELWLKLQTLSKETMIPISKLLDKGIELVLNKYEKPVEKQAFFYNWGSLATFLGTVPYLLI